MMNRVLLEESLIGRCDSTPTLYVVNDDSAADSLLVVTKANKTAQSIETFFRSAFLPEGYPWSVSGDYWGYQYWDSLQAFASSVTGTLATHAVLKGSGVGNAAATPLAATIAWLWQDGAGTIGRIAFTHLQGSALDSDCKRWRLFADVLLDLAILTDLISPSFDSNYFRLARCTSGVAKALVGTAGGATRAALTQHQARRNNTADVSAKDGSQETIVNLAALLFCLLFVPLVTSSPIAVWMSFVIFTGMHIYCNYKAVRAVHMEAFNLRRFVATVLVFLSLDRCPKMSEVNESENVWFFKNNEFDMNASSIRLGVQLKDHGISSGAKLGRLLEAFSGQQYILTYSQFPKPRVYVSFFERANVEVHFRAAFHAVVVLSKLKEEEHKDIEEVLEASLKHAKTRFEKFSREAKACGFDFERSSLLAVGDWVLARRNE